MVYSHPLFRIELRPVVRVEGGYNEVICATKLLQVRMVRELGLEPKVPAWRAGMLPQLHHSRTWLKAAGVESWRIAVPKQRNSTGRLILPYLKMYELDEFTAINHIGGADGTCTRSDWPTTSHVSGYTTAP